MTTGTRIFVGTLLATGVTLAIVFRKKVVAQVKRVGKLVIGDSAASTPGGTGVLKRGSEDVQHIEQLQGALNDITDAVKHINSKCSMTWGLYPGGMLQENGVFDNRTEDASQFYLNRKEVDLEYLNEIRGKIKKYKAGDRCKYPLSY